ncbi:hypothetical protein B0H63DRAFT_456193 [Podospora didyma]|uniref:Uncharacterized protein n=1 Tax=Podospora didyma TaxID=330526 RepID=A0AAE0JY59_9PEZI|nr:hypothetical protein B0H63DRAFT_456193 [Podospora didyma]
MAVTAMVAREKVVAVADLASLSSFARNFSEGVARVHREKLLFEMLPDSFQRQLQKILGGSPFDSKFGREAGGARHGFANNIKSKLLDKIRSLVRKWYETLRGSILGVVNGGHRKFERKSWVSMHYMVEQEVQTYSPNVKISVPDDIGNEGVNICDKASDPL